MKSGGLLVACAVAAASSLLPQAAAADYAVLVAGSRGYANYRHQADVCHAYQILTKGGIPAKNIIVMMYDDVARSDENPMQGKLFNRDTRGRGYDVYKGCKVDYRGADVTAANFVAVLTGDKKQSNGKPVLGSTAADNVFVNFVDHGGVGVIAFPDEFMSATTLLQALQTMHNRQMYNELVFYLESCESGSMFTNLPPNMKIYATTAASADQASWGTYCPPNGDIVHGTKMMTCLGDLYSVNWMENADVVNLNNETLEVQYRKVAARTKSKSTVMQFGSLRIRKAKAAVFEGHGRTHRFGEEGRGLPDPSGDHATPASSRDIPLLTRYTQYSSATTLYSKLKYADLLKAEIDARLAADVKFASVVEKVVASGVGGLQEKRGVAAEARCRDEANAAAAAHCGYTDYSLKYSKDVVSLCPRTGYDPAPIIAAIKSVCSSGPNTSK